MPKQNRKLSLAKLDAQFGLLVMALDKLESRVDSDLEDQDEAIEALSKRVTTLVDRVEKLEERVTLNAEGSLRLSDGRYVSPTYVEQLEAVRDSLFTKVGELKSELSNPGTSRWSLRDFLRNWSGSR